MSNYYKQIMPAPEGLRVIYVDDRGDEFASRRVVALGLTENGDVLPLVIEDGFLRSPACFGGVGSWSLSLQ